MTQIIRLNDSINDYSSRPVITPLGEPIISIHPETYQNKFSDGQTLQPTDVIVDGSIGKTAPKPFDKFRGTNPVVFKKDANGSYLNFNKTSIYSDSNRLYYTTNKSALAVVKFRVNNMDGATANMSPPPRIFTMSPNYQMFNIQLNLDDKNNPFIEFNVASTGFAIYAAVRQPLVLGKIYTAVLLRTLTACIIIVDGVTMLKNDVPFNPDQLGYPIYDLSLNQSVIFPERLMMNTDIFGFELYADVDVTESQLLTYAKSL